MRNWFTSFKKENGYPILLSVLSAVASIIVYVALGEDQAMFVYIIIFIIADVTAGLLTPTPRGSSLRESALIISAGGIGWGFAKLAGIVGLTPTMAMTCYGLGLIWGYASRHFKWMRNSSAN
jgi:hypothetical protein